MKDVTTWSEGLKELIETMAVLIRLISRSSKVKWYLLFWGTRRGAQLSWAPPWQLDRSACLFRKWPLGPCLFFWSSSVLKKGYVQSQKWTLTCQRCQTRVVLIVHQHISKHWLLICVRVHAMGFTKSNKVVKTYIVVLLILAAIYVFAVQEVVLSSN